MPLTRAHRRTARRIDAEAKTLLDRGGREALLLGLKPLLIQFKTILATATPDEMDGLCEAHPHFAEVLILTSSLAEGIATGDFADVPGPR